MNNFGYHARPLYFLLRRQEYIHFIGLDNTSLKSLH